MSRRRERVQTGRSNRSRPDSAASIDVSRDPGARPLSALSSRPPSSRGGTANDSSPPAPRPVSALRHNKTPGSPLRPGTGGSRPGTGASRPGSSYSRPSSSRAGTAHLYQERPWTSTSSVQSGGNQSEVLFINDDGPDTVVYSKGRPQSSYHGNDTGGRAGQRRPHTTHGDGQVTMDTENSVWVVRANASSRPFVKSGQADGWKPVPAQRTPVPTVTNHPQLRHSSTNYNDTTGHTVPQSGTGLFAGPDQRFQRQGVNNRTIASEEREHKLKARAAREQRVRGHADRINEQSAMAQIHQEAKEAERLKAITKQKIEHLNHLADLNKPRAQGGKAAVEGASALR